MNCSESHCILLSVVGVYICLTPIVLVDLLGLDKLNDAFGLVLLFQGIGGVAGPPLAGMLHITFREFSNLENF